MDKVLVATRIDGRTHRTLTGISQREDPTVAYLLRKAVEEFVDRQGRQAEKSPALSRR